MLFSIGNPTISKTKQNHQIRLSNQTYTAESGSEQRTEPGRSEISLILRFEDFSSEGFCLK